MKISTCALMPFEANDVFFSRDSGLLCRSLQRMGVDSHVILPAAPDTDYAQDPSDVIRASYEKLADPTWWCSLGIHGVAFVTWGFKQHTGIIRAAREAGIVTIALFDSNCSGLPYLDVREATLALWRKGFLSEPMPRRILGFLARVAWLSWKGLTTHYDAISQARDADYAGYNSPSALKRSIRKERFFFGKESKAEMLLMGYPVRAGFSVSPAGERRKTVISIARWDAIRHKRPHVLMGVAERVISQVPDVTFEIYGRTPVFMWAWHEKLDESLRARILLQGVRPSEEVSAALGRSMVLYCPSASEGVPLPVPEALCSGCTVVGLQTAEIPGLAWASQEGDGCFTRVDTIDRHAEAVIQELTAWTRAERHPETIARRWQEWFSAGHFAERVTAVVKNHLADNPSAE